MKILKLTKIQEKVLEEIVASGITEGFYLADGTALMMRYHHRFSGDFDFFLLPGRKFDVRSKISGLDGIRILDEKKDTLIFEKDSIKCSFFDYDYPLLEPVVELNGYGVVAASDTDITCMKAVAVIQRGEKKDFFDLWYLMTLHNWGLEDVIEFCRAKYGDVFNPSLLIKALTFFEDAERDEIADVDSKWKGVKNYFLELVESTVVGRE